KAGMRVGVDQHQESNILPCLQQPLGHLQSHQAAKRVADQDIRAFLLHLVQGAKIELCHILDAVKRFLPPINTLGLNSVDRMAGLNVFRELGEPGAAAQSMGHKNRRLYTARLQANEGRELREDSLLQQSGEARDRRSVEYRGAR